MYIDVCSVFTFCSALCCLGGCCFPRPSLPYLNLLTAQAFPPSCAVNFLSTSSSSSLLPSTLFSSPLLSSYVDEIRWFLLGEASVHPSAAPSRARPTPSTQVINKPANSHSPSMTYCLFSTSAVLYVRPCPHAAPCELTASQHTDGPLDFSIYPSEKEACLRMFWTEVTDGSLGHVAMLREEQQRLKATIS